MEMTPYIGCNCHCLYCWRMHSRDRPELKWEFPLSIKEMDEPDEIVDDAIRMRRELLIGFKGNPKVDGDKLTEAKADHDDHESHWGANPIPEDIRVSCGGPEERYDNLPRYERDDAECLGGDEPPALSLYASVSAPDKDTYIRLVRSLIRDGW